MTPEILFGGLFWALLMQINKSTQLFITDVDLFDVI